MLKLQRVRDELLFDVFLLINAMHTTAKHQSELRSALRRRFFGL